VARAPAKRVEPKDLRDLVGKRLTASKLIARVIDSLGEDETFGASRVAAETNRRYHRTLKKPVDARTVSTVLRRRRDVGELRQVRPGSAARLRRRCIPGEGGGKDLTVRVALRSASQEGEEASRGGSAGESIFPMPWTGSIPEPQASGMAVRLSGSHPFAGSPLGRMAPASPSREGELSAPDGAGDPRP
jgi:hypothetical protein